METGRPTGDPAQRQEKPPHGTPCYVPSAPAPIRVQLLCFRESLVPSDSNGAQAVCLPVSAASPAVLCHLLAAPPAPTHLFHCKRKICLQQGGEIPGVASPPLPHHSHGVRPVFGKSPWEGIAAVWFHISFGSWWGKPNPSVGVSLGLTYGVGYIHGEAVRSIPRSFSLFSPFHIYPTGSSSPHHNPSQFSHRRAKGELQPHRAAELETSLLEMNPEGNQLLVAYLFPQQIAFCI